MTAQETLARLEELGSERMREQNVKRGATQDQFGVKLGDIRALAKSVKTDHELAMTLWETGNIDAQLLSILLMQPKALSADEVDRLVRSAIFVQVADWLNAYVVKKHLEKEPLRLRWMTSEDPMAARAGWNLTAERVEKQPEGLDLSAILDRIESEMADAPEPAQWTMNVTLAAIGINHAKSRERAVTIGECLGVYRDYPVPRGCTSPFAPALVSRLITRRGEVRARSDADCHSSSRSTAASERLTKSGW